MPGRIPAQTISWIRSLIALLLVRVPLNTIATALTLYLTSRCALAALGDTHPSHLGTTSLTITLTSVGAVIGCMAGFISALQATLLRIEDDLRDWLVKLSSDDAQRLFPQIEVSRLQSGYEDLSQSVYSSTIGRLPLPALLQRSLYDRISRTMVADFLDECHERGTTSVGFAEVRDGLLLRAVPLVTRPVHTQFRVAHCLLATLLLACVGIPLLVAYFA